jgi:hypothetical protein
MDHLMHPKHQKKMQHFNGICSRGIMLRKMESGGERGLRMITWVMWWILPWLRECLAVVAQ